MGPQPAASSTPSRLPRRLHLPRNPSITFSPHPLTHFSTGAASPFDPRSHPSGMAASPFNPLAPAASGGHTPKPPMQSLGGLAAADIQRPSSGHHPPTHSALDRLPGLPDRRQGLRRCSSLRGPPRSAPVDSVAESDPHGSEAMDSSRERPRQAVYDAAHLDMHPRMNSMPEAGSMSSMPLRESSEEPELMTAASEMGFGRERSADHVGACRVSAGMVGNAKGQASGPMEQGGAPPQMPSTPDQTCSEDGSPPHQRLVRTSATGSSAALYCSFLCWCFGDGSQSHGSLLPCTAWWTSRLLAERKC